MTRRVDIAGLKAIDRAVKPNGFDEECIRLTEYYEDRSRNRTVTRLSELGVGIKDNARPLELSLVRRIVDRLAIVYDKPASRWLISSDGTKMPEDSIDHINMTRVLERAVYDQAMRHIDKTKALLRQDVIRVFPSDSRGSCVIRTFSPFNVIRSPGANDPDSMDGDHAFALMLSAGDQWGMGETWEYWIRYDDTWAMARVDETGRMLPDQPFDLRESRETAPTLADLIMPYDELPVMIVYDEYTGGRPWLAPRMSRSSFAEAVNAISNDLWNLIVNQSHTDRFFKTDNTADIPTKKGPGMAAAIPSDTDVIDLTPNPKISESQQVLESFIKLWSVSEDLPVDEFLNRQTTTGAVLKAAERALNSRRESQILLVSEDERRLYAKLRSVHNVHTGSTEKWDLPALRTDLSLEIQTGESTTPVDFRELEESMARSITLGSKSTIDLIQAQNGCSRKQAIAIYARVSEDRALYPPPVPAAEIQSGPRLAGVTTTETEFDDTAEAAGEDSVVDLIVSGSQAAQA